MKITAKLLVLVMILGLTACSSQEAASESGAEQAPVTEAKPGTTKDTEGGFKIGYNNNGDNDSFSKTLHDGTEAAAEAAGIPFLYAESNFAPDKIQANNNTLILQGASVIVDFNVTPDAYTTLLAEYEAQGVPILMVDTYTEGAYFFGANNSVAGSTAGNFMVDYANENWDGNIDQVVTVGTWTQGQVVMDRCDGIIAGVVEKIPDFDVDNNYTAVECGGSTSDQMTQVMAKVKDILIMNEDAEHICIGVYSEHLMQALFSAVEQAGREEDVMIVSLGCEDYFKEDVKTDAHPYWAAAVAFFPERYGEYIVNICKKFAAGEEVPTMNYMDHIAVDRVTVKELYRDYFS